MSASTSSSHRLGFIDQLRGWAVIIMIEVHTFNEWLRADLKQLDIWTIVTFINGLVAPSFVMLAGFSLGLASARKWDDYTRPGLPLWKRIRHLLLILLVGYILHIPAKSYRFWKYWVMPEKVAEFQAVDVLQLIVASLLILHLLILVTRSRKALLWGSLVLGTLAFGLTPWAYSTDVFNGLPLWLANYFNKAGKSLFPLFPWSGFVFYGTFLSLLYADWQKDGRGTEFLRYMAYLGGILVAAGMIAHYMPITLQSHYEFSRTSPQFAYIRLGIVLLLLFSLWFIETRWKRAPKLVRLMGQESFLVYSFHLIVLYSKFGEHSLATLWNGKFGFLECAIGYLVFLIPNFAIAYGWNRLKQRSMPAARWTMAGIAVAALIMFFFFENGQWVWWIFNPNDPYK